MHRSVLNQQLRHSPIAVGLRKAFDFLHFRQLSTKAGIGVLSGLVMGTGVVWATAQAGSPAPLMPSTQPVSNTAEDVTPTTVPHATVPAADTNLHNSSQSTNNSGSGSNSTTSYTEVQVNNETIPIPVNGSIHKTITDEHGTTRVDVDTQSLSQNGTTSYTNIQTQTYSSGTTSSSSSSTQSGVNN